MSGNGTVGASLASHQSTSSVASGSVRPLSSTSPNSRNVAVLREPARNFTCSAARIWSAPAAPQSLDASTTGVP